MENNEICNFSEELTHWGIKGMRWGIRRYQNKDGSLTDAGKKKLRAEQAKVREQEQTNKNRKAVQARIDRLNARKKAAKDEKDALDEAAGIKLFGKGKKSSADTKKEASEETKTSKPKKNKSIEDMSDEELAKAVNRARLLSEYNRLQPDQVQQGAQAVQSAKKSGFMSKMWDQAVVPAAIESGKKFLNTAMSKGIEKVFGDKVDPNSVEMLEKLYKKLDLEQKIDKFKNPGKYESEEEKGKRQKREHDDADWNARLEGYKNAADKARAEREQAEAEKANRLEAARAAQSRAGSDNAHSRFINNVTDKGEGRTPGWRQTASRVTDGLEYESSKNKDTSTPSKTVNNKTKTVTYPSQKEWDSFVSEYSWGVDKPVSSVSNRMTSLGEKYANRTLSLGNQSEGKRYTFGSYTVGTGLPKDDD